MNVNTTMEVASILAQTPQLHTDVLVTTTMNFWLMDTAVNVTQLSF